MQEGKGAKEDDAEGARLQRGTLQGMGEADGDGEGLGRSAGERGNETGADMQAGGGEVGESGNTSSDPIVTSLDRSLSESAGRVVAPDHVARDAPAAPGR